MYASVSALSGMILHTGGWNTRVTVNPREPFTLQPKMVSCLQNIQESSPKEETVPNFLVLFIIYLFIFLEKSLEEEKSSSSPPPAEHLLTSKPKEKQESAAVEAPKDAKRESRRCETAISSDCGPMQMNIFILYLPCFILYFILYLPPPPRFHRMRCVSVPPD